MFNLIFDGLCALPEPPAAILAIIILNHFEAKQTRGGDDVVESRWIRSLLATF